MRARAGFVLAVATLLLASAPGSVAVTARAAGPEEAGAFDDMPPSSADAFSTTTSNSESGLLATSGQATDVASTPPPAEWDNLDSDQPRWSGLHGALVGVERSW